MLKQNLHQKLLKKKHQNETEIFQDQMNKQSNLTEPYCVSEYEFCQDFFFLLRWKNAKTPNLWGDKKKVSHQFQQRILINWFNESN